MKSLSEDVIDELRSAVIGLWSALQHHGMMYLPNAMVVSCMNIMHYIAIFPGTFSEKVRKRQPQCYGIHISHVELPSDVTIPTSELCPVISNQFHTGSSGFTSPHHQCYCQRMDEWKNCCCGPGARNIYMYFSSFQIT